MEEFVLKIKKRTTKKIGDFYNDNHLKYIFSMAMRYKRKYVFLILLKVVFVAITYIIPLINMKIIDDGITGRNYYALGLNVALFIILNIFSSIVNYYVDITQYKITNRMNIFLQDLAVDYCINRNNDELDESTRGEVESYLMRDVFAFSSVSSSIFEQGLFNILKVITSTILLFYLQYDLASGVILLQLLIIYCRLRMNSNVEKLAVKNRRVFSNFMTATIEIVNNVRNIKLINAYNYISNKYSNANQEYVQSTENVAKKGQMYSLIAMLLGVILISIMLIVGGYKVINGAMTIGLLITFMQYSGNFTEPIMSLAGISTTISSNKQEITNISEILDYSNSAKFQSYELPKKINEISINNLNFEYRDNERIFENASVHFESGKISYLTGESGIGKSTLFKLLTKDYSVERSMINFDGVDICDISQSDLLGYYGIVTQDPLIFQDTVWNNITLKNEYSKEEVITVCKDCAILDVINGMENGFDTEISENGFNISAGQKQRISLARALLQNKNIILIDEVTSGIDSKNEEYIRKSLSKYAKGKIILIITHSKGFIDEKSDVYSIKSKKIVKN